jgi:predicted ATP-binding protein involved in virulence
MNLKKSLKPIKKRFQRRDNPFISIRQVYPHLSELNNEEILEYYNVVNIKMLKEHIQHIKKILKNKTENYSEEMEKINGCFCMDSREEFKYLYTTQKEAEKQIKHSLKTKRVKLLLYPCPYHSGWHLSRT